MILEIIVSGFFSGLGSTAFRELMNQSRKKDESKLRSLIRDELEKWVHMSPSVPIRTDDATINAIVEQLRTKEILASPIYTEWRNDAATYKILSEHSGKVLDVSGWGKENGIAIQQYDYHGGANQHWRLTRVR